MWELVNNRRLLFGPGKTGEIPAVLAWYGLKKVFFAVYDRHAPVCASLCAALAEVGIGHVLYDAVQGEPDLHVINRGRDLFLAEGCDCTLAVGGGSVIDAAKAIGMLATNGGMVEEYQMQGRQVRCLPPFFVAVPTTAGTGAEATKVAVVYNNDNGLKKSLYHTTMIADVVVLDPELTTGLSRQLTAATGMDALSHAIESYVSLNATPLTEMFGLKAVELITKALPLACDEPGNLKARADMLLASYLGGCAISAGIGIAHIMAQPIGAMYKIPHGDACSIFLPLAMEYNLECCQAKYARLALALDVYDPAGSDGNNARAAIAAVKALRARIGAPDSLAPYLHGATPDLDFVVETVHKTTGHITCNPRPVDAAVWRLVFGQAC